MLIKIFIGKIVSLLRLPIFKIQWIKKNKHNQTIPNNIFDMNKVTVGNYTYGKLDVHMYGNEKEELHIGHFCSIGGNVMFILGGNHPYKNLSTYPIKNKIINKGFVEASTKGKITIGSDVWIGERSIILSGVSIGQGAVIGAGSIVSKDIPPYAVYIGNQVVKYRFSDELIKKLLQIDFGKITKEFLENNIDAFYQEVNADLLEKTAIKKLI